MKAREKKIKKPPIDYQKSLSLKPSFRLEITGLNQMRLINTLSAQGVCLNQIERLSGKLLRVSILKQEAKKAFLALDNLGCGYKIIEEKSVGAAAVLLMKNIGLVVGILVFSIMSAISNSFVWSIKISGNKTIDSRVIQLQLSKHGVKQWANKHTLDTDSIASLLRGIDGIAEGSAYIKGTTLYVNVYESQVYLPPDNNTLSGDILSTHDAQITKIVTQSGTPVVKLGDNVAANTPLIKGEIYNTNGELLQTVRARGKVYGKVTFTQSHIFSPIEDVREFTGKTKKHTYITIFGLRIGKSSISDTQGWERETKKFSSFLIPIKFTQISYRQTRITQTQRDIDSYTNELKSQALLNNVIKAGGSEIETITSLTEIEGGLLRFNIYIQAEMLIGSF